MIPFEDENIKAYTLLLRIEIIMRECLKKALEKEYGSQWQKKLSGELLKKIREAQADEKKPQFGFTRLGPLYYLTFGELLTQLRQKPSRAVTEQMGGDCFLKQLENILTPRNAICHSRPVSSVGLKTIEALYSQIETALTPGILQQLISNPDTGLSQDKAALGLIPALEGVLSRMNTLPASFAIPDLFESAKVQFWWSDEALSGINFLLIDSAFNCIKEYNALPVGVGSAGIRQRFIETNNMKAKVENAIMELNKV